MDRTGDGNADGNVSPVLSSPMRNHEGHEAELEAELVLLRAQVQEKNEQVAQLKKVRGFRGFALRATS